MTKALVAASTSWRLMAVAGKDQVDVESAWACIGERMIQGTAGEGRQGCDTLPSERKHLRQLVYFPKACRG